MGLAGENSGVVVFGHLEASGLTLSKCVESVPLVPRDHLVI